MQPGIRDREGLLLRPIQWVLLPDGWQMWWRGVWRARSCVPIGARVVCSWECAEKLAR